MYELPYISISKEILIPHPGADYTLSCSLDTEIVTQNAVIDNTEYKNLFIILLDDCNTTVCSICLLQNVAYTQKEQIIYFTAVSKVKLQKKKKSTCLVTFFEDKELSQVNKNALNNLLTFIKQTKELSFISNFIVDDQDYELTISVIATLLYLTSEASAKIYSLIDFKSRMNIIYDGLLSTITMMSNQLDKDGEIKTNIPSHVASKIEQEEARLNNISPSSPEYSSTLDYLEILNSIPWQTYSSFENDISLAETSLNNLHYGLKEVKEDFLDFLYLEKLTDVKASTCFLFDGPPGVGKTSLAKSIAKALKRDFIFISLAGASDEAEIRGHRRTYTGSKPGRIVSSLTKSSSMNPIIVLDELDKIAQVHGMKPIENSLLELFDAEQSASFIDRYLEVPVDLSKAIFICTSNSTTTISKPLLDRLQLVTFEDYSQQEKENIIEEYIFPKIINDYNLNSFDLHISNSLKELLASEYSLRDARSLLSRCLRRKAKSFLAHKQTSNILDDKSIAPFINKKAKTRRIGFANCVN